MSKIRFQTIFATLPITPYLSKTHPKRSETYRIILTLTFISKFNTTYDLTMDIHSYIVGALLDVVTHLVTTLLQLFTAGTAGSLTVVWSVVSHTQHCDTPLVHTLAVSLHTHTHKHTLTYKHTNLL